MSARGFLTGSLALIVLETLVQKGASDKAGGLIAKTAEVVHHILSPSTPGLHWYAGGGAAAAGVGGQAPTTLGKPSSSGAVVVKAGPQNPTVDRFVNVGAVRSVAT